MDWLEISSQKGLTEEFIRENTENIDWYCISLNNIPFSEDFMRTYKEQLHWRSVSKVQVLSEDFIREMKDVVEWAEIARTQVMSYEFILEHFQFLENFYLRQNQKLYFTEAQWHLLGSYEYVNDIMFFIKKADDTVTLYEAFFNPELFPFASQFDEIECSVVKDPYSENCTAQLYGIKTNVEENTSNVTVIRAKEMLPEFAYKACYKKISLLTQRKKIML